MVGRVAQSVERRSDKAKVLGSSPSMTTTPFCSGPRGAMEARRFPEPEVVGSIPTAGAFRPERAAARLAQSVARGSHNPKVVSSILAPRNFLGHERQQRDSNPRSYAYWAYALTS